MRGDQDQDRDHQDHDKESEQFGVPYVWIALTAYIKFLRWRDLPAKVWMESREKIYIFFGDTAEELNMEV